MVDEVFAAVDLTHFPLVPVGTRGREAVGDEATVVTDRPVRQVHRAVFGEFVRID